MKIPIFKRINREDIPDAEDWVGRLLYPINSVFETVYKALNRSLTFQDNIASFTKTLQFTTKATYSSGEWDVIQFAIPDHFKTRAFGVLIVSGGPMTTAVTAISGNYLNWSQDDRLINLNWVGGLADSTKYSFSFLVF